MHSPRTCYCCCTCRFHHVNAFDDPESGTVVFDSIVYATKPPVSTLRLVLMTTHVAPCIETSLINSSTRSFDHTRID